MTMTRCFSIRLQDKTPPLGAAILHLTTLLCIHMLAGKASSAITTGQPEA